MTGTIILAAIIDYSNLIIYGEEVIMLFSDLSLITLCKHKRLTVLITRLLKKRIKYKWGFPFKLVIDYRLKRIISRTEVGRKFLE